MVILIELVHINFYKINLCYLDGEAVYAYRACGEHSAKIVQMRRLI